jgi:hypothetical protein
MNLISAILSLNAQAIAKIPFNQASLILGHSDTVKSDIEIKINKLTTPEMKRPEITATVSDGEKSLEFDFDYVGDGRYVRYEPPLASVRRRMQEDLDRFQNFLADRIAYSWLPVQRTELLDRYVPPDERDLPPLDRKIRQIVVDMTKYLSSLDKRASDVINEFQQQYFLSMLNYKPPEAPQPIPLETVRNALTAIFDEFKVPKNLYRDKITAHFAQLNQYDSKNHSLIVSDLIRLHELTLRWQEFDQRRAEIYRSKVEFADIFNRLFLKKRFSFDERNQPKIVSERFAESHITSLEELSSGEKQMLIILGETLLQEQKGYIFLADEPELSLHIEWQKDLVHNIRRLNPASQIVFATHSPDIVQRYSKNTIDLEDITD